VSDVRGKRIRDESLAFMGGIIAGQSHEATNVLNIIGELVGLQQDRLLAAGRGKQVDLPKLEEICNRIQCQVTRGHTIIRNINMFAHSVDTSLAVFDVRETVSRIVMLAERYTRLKQVQLMAELRDETIVLENSPFFFQCAVFVCIDVALSAAAERRKISVSYALAEGGAEVAVASADPVQGSPEVTTKLNSLRWVVEELGGELRALPGRGDADRLSFFVSNRAQRSYANGAAAQTEDCL